jgi:hypothetical protein
MIPNMTTPEDPGQEKTRPVDIKGRAVEVQQLLDAQLLLLSREARLASKESTEGNRRVVAVGRIFDLLESVMVNEEDKEYLIELIVKRNLELDDLRGFITAFSDDDEPEEKPRVRRGRPPTKRS